MGRRSPSRAGLLYGSSSISSTTLIVRVALTGRAKKGLHVLRCPVFYRKYRRSSGVARNFKRGAIISTLFDRFFIRQNYFKAD